VPVYQRRCRSACLTVSVWPAVRNCKSKGLAVSVQDKVLLTSKLRANHELRENVVRQISKIESYLAVYRPHQPILSGYVMRVSSCVWITDIYVNRVTCFADAIYAVCRIILTFPQSVAGGRARIKIGFQSVWEHRDLLAGRVEGKSSSKRFLMAFQAPRLLSGAR
jgi:hypothetical protein